MRAVISGTRYYKDYYPKFEAECMRIFAQLHEEGFNISRDKLVIATGKLKGVEGLARLFTDMHNLPLRIIYSDGVTGPAATHIRNANMVEYAKEDPELGVVIAFHDGVSVVTEDLINLAQMENVRTYVVNC